MTAASIQLRLRNLEAGAYHADNHVEGIDEHLRQISEKVDQVAADVTEIKDRLGRVEEHLTALGNGLALILTRLPE